MYVQITTGLEINEQEIIQNYCLDSNCDEDQIRVSVDDYIAGLDDCDFYIMVREDAFQQVVDKIKELLGVE